MIERGSGPPLVLIPGIQGRWEWMEPTVRALASRFRVLTSSLAGEPGSGIGADEGQEFDVQARIVERMLDQSGVKNAVLVGVSFGGLVAAYVASTRPGRVTALVLASTPGPDWRPDAKARRYMRAPLLLAPAIVIGAPWRVGPEILRAAATTAERLAFVRAQVWRVCRSPAHPALMGARLRLMAATRAREWCDAITVPTLVITGEPGLDRVVPVAGTLRYAETIRGARVAELTGTGHIGSVTKPREFAEAIWGFVRSCDDSSH